MRYLTPWAWKEDKRSLKSGYIESHAFQRVGGGGDLGNRVHPLVYRAALPVSVFACDNPPKMGKGRVWRPAAGVDARPTRIDPQGFTKATPGRFDRKSDPH
jgi:hypothetical protein